MPRIRELGLVIPDPELAYDEAAGRWTYTEPDWDELRSVVTGHGPKSQERLDFRRVSYARHAVGPRRDPRPAARRAEPPAERDGSRARVWEVFRQEAEGDPMVHGGSVNAPDAELALHYAREFYGRRQESDRLWIVPRDAITELDDPDLLNPPFDRSFKRPGGYIIKHKLEAARETAPGQPADRGGGR